MGMLLQDVLQWQEAGKVAALEKKRQAEENRVFLIEDFFEFYCEQYSLEQIIVAPHFYRGVGMIEHTCQKTEKVFGKIYNNQFTYHARLS